ncbi:hypothetical protein AAEO56_06050 [Flavobacterium sp. DGU11]|uniref:Uncharacterized protein n=1 Tax=Flavobacterium arundinis TaxID=3139143 RepID=A0ABU9HVU1_9FLAO
MKAGLQFWFKFSLLNLLVVAIIGLLMRYKIGFEFPYLNQKNLQFSHYHFAFYGWISHTLMVLMVHCLLMSDGSLNVRKFGPVFITNLIASYGMLLSFIAFGYGVTAVVFSVIAIAASFWFSILYIKELKRAVINTIASKWFKAALLFNVISAAGVFALAYMMLTKNVHQNEYLVSVYYFLHFQYNGWFFFACMGLFMNYINAQGQAYVVAYRLFFVSCIPAYFLSVLWLDLPLWLYVIVMLSALAQLWAWLLIIKQVLRANHIIRNSLPFILQYILLFVGTALSIKLLLQLGSTIPVISKLAFGFRPVVIAYLHLVLLAIITLFLLYYMYAVNILTTSRKVLLGLLLFSVGVLLNEVILAVQGVAAFTYTIVPLVNEALFIAALILVSGIGILYLYTIKKG